MNTLYIWGPILEGDGLATWNRSHGLDLERCPVDGGLADEQPARIPVHINHRGPTIGEVVHLEHIYDQVFAVAEVDLDRVDPDDLPAHAETTDWTWSATIRRGPGSTPRSRGRSTLMWTVAQGTLTELSLTQSPASLLRPVRSIPDRPSRRSLDKWQHRAADTIAERRHRVYPPPLRVLRLDDHGKPIQQHPSVLRSSGRRGPDGLVYQTSAHLGRVLSVS